MKKFRERNQLEVLILLTALEIFIIFRANSDKPSNTTVKP